ncbi:hypothetical protein [Citrobacter freundii]|uniref:hypothetical protein n=1 Tax=Citrobacter freundii TaxID=546 RepID=UPI0015FCA370|nr:hypothetical protein [Citrobacter freundii]MBA7947170.1 hypothetical protein [Citrobacter freundii]
MMISYQELVRTFLRSGDDEPKADSVCDNHPMGGYRVFGVPSLYPTQPLKGFVE